MALCEQDTLRRSQVCILYERALTLSNFAARETDRFCPLMNAEQNIFICLSLSVSCDQSNGDMEWCSAAEVVLLEPNVRLQID